MSWCGLKPLSTSGCAVVSVVADTFSYCSFPASWSVSVAAYNKAEGMETTSTSYRYIVRSPEVRGGHARVEGTRIGVHDVIGLIVNGATVDDVCRSFPDLKRSHVYECLAYYEDHRAAIDDLVAGQMHDPNA